MNCEVCLKGMADGIALLRQNPKGEAGIWRCTLCNVLPVDSSVKLIIDCLLTEPAVQE